MLQLQTEFCAKWLVVRNSLQKARSQRNQPNITRPSPHEWGLGTRLLRWSSCLSEVWLWKRAKITFILQFHDSISKDLGYSQPWLPLLWSLPPFCLISLSITFKNKKDNVFHVAQQTMHILNALYTFVLMTTGAFNRNVSKLFSKLKLVTDNLLFIYAEANWEATKSYLRYVGRNVW